MSSTSGLSAYFVSLPHQIMGCNGSKEEASMSSANPLLWATPEMFRNDFSDTIAASDKAKIYNLICGSSHTKGGRAYMEDIDVQFDAIHIAPTAYVSLYGIFDGHGGRDCAVYVSKYLPIRIFANLKNPAKQSAEVVYSAFREVDREWLNVANNDAGKMKDAGSTGTIFVWRSDESRGYVANVGDTRAVLCRRGRAIDMTKDHKATDPEVIEQVTQRGGFVNNNRINGILAGKTSLPAIFTPLSHLPRSRQRVRRRISKDTACERRPTEQCAGRHHLHTTNT